MTSTVPAEAAPGTVAARLSPLVVALAAGILGAAIACYDVTRSGALHGIIQYDDGAYYASAVRLLGGSLPYRSYTFVQPPGITLLLAPIAALTHGAGTRVGLAAARLLTAAVAGVNAYLAGAAVAHRGRLAAAVAGTALAVYPAAFFADRTVMLEPYLVLFCLLAVRTAFPGGRLAGGRRLLLAGVLLGCGAAVKTWALLPLVALVLVALAARDTRRRAGMLGVGALIGGGATYLPFFAAAPAAMWREVVVAQLERPATVHPFFVSLAVLDGVHGLDLAAGRPVILTVAALLAAIVLGGSALPLARRRGDAFEGFCLLASVSAVAAVLGASEFYDHYAYFPAAFGAVLAGCIAERTLAGARRRLAGWRAQALAATALLCGIGVLAALVGSETAYARGLAAHAGDPAVAIDIAVPAGACAVSDAAILLVTADRLTARSSCPVPVDPEGAALAVAPRANAATELATPAFVRSWERALGHAAFFVRSASARHRLPDTAGFARFLARTYRRLPDPGASVYVRRTSPLASTALDPARWTRRALAAAGWRPPAPPVR